MDRDQLTRLVRHGEGLDDVAKRLVGRMYGRAWMDGALDWDRLARELEEALRELHLEAALIDIDWPTRSLDEYAALLVGDVLAARDGGQVDLTDARRRVLRRLTQMRTDLRIRRTR